MPAPADAGPQPGAPEAAAGVDFPITEPGAPIPEPMATQSADEILAAARARIQKRASATAKTDPAILHDAPPDAPPEPTVPASLPMDADPPLETVDPVQAKSLTAAIEASGFHELPITARHAATVAALPLHHADPFDRLLLAQAFSEPLHLLTVDRALVAYGGGVTVL